MKTFNNQPNKTLKSRALGLALAAVLIPAGFAMANGSAYNNRPVVTTTSGHVEVVHQVPGGTISVGVQIGKPRPVVVEERRRVIVVEKAAPRPRQVTIIREVPRHDYRREVTVVKTVGHGRNRHEVVVVKHEGPHGRDWDKRDERNVSFHDDRSGHERTVYVH